MVKTFDLAYAYQNEQQLLFPNIDLTTGEHMLVLGPSGVGKTTLLYLLSGLLQPLGGTVSINGINLGSMNRKKIDKFRGEHIGHIFQQYHFIKSLNVSENLRLRQRCTNSADSTQRRYDLVERLGLEKQLQKKVTELSQGQQQRLCIALGLIHKPTIILADEPTSNLDDANCTKVIDLLKEEAKICKSSLLIITHDLRVMTHFQNQVRL